jgi:predicted nucleic acid-binding protein
VVVADSDVLIEAMERGREPAASRVAALLRRGDLATTAVSVYELTAGPRTTAAQLELLHVWLAPLAVLPVTRGSADVSAAVHRHLARRGEAIPVPDTLIAGVCIENGLPLLTRNVVATSRLTPPAATSIAARCA